MTVERKALEQQADADLLAYCKAAGAEPVLSDCDEANKTWMANCGPMSLAAVLGRTTVESVRELVMPFRGFMAPRDMLTALASAYHRGLAGKSRYTSSPGDDAWPDLGIVRIQWLGPWCGPDVDPRAAYRYTHMVGVRRPDRRSKECATHTEAIGEACRAGRLPIHELRIDEPGWSRVLIYDCTPNRWIPLEVWSAWAPSIYPKRTTGWAPVTRFDVTRAP